MADQSDGYIGFAAAAALCPPRGGRRLSPSSIWRWCREGVKARNGAIVRLKCQRIGGRVFTRKEWLDEFFAELTTQDQEHFEQADAVARPPERSAERELRLRRAELVNADL